jgi:hypothetical protein
LPDEAIGRLRQLPIAMQDGAARTLMRQLEEEPEPGDHEALEAAQAEFENGVTTHDQWRHEMGIDDR